MPEPKADILLVEDSLLVSSRVREILEDAGFRASAATTAAEAAAAVEKGHFDLVLLDLMLPDGDGRKLLARWKPLLGEMVVVMMTAHGDKSKAECVGLGAYDFLEKPVEPEILVHRIENALSHGRLSKKVEALAGLSAREPEAGMFGEIVAPPGSPLAKTIDISRLVAATDFSCVLVTGESGSGKGMFARALHKMGRRSGKPFVEVNCSALPASLIESELFGHVKGAFTDAKENKMGLFEMADAGTLFLDEIGDMDLNLQAKLLKVMEEQRLRRVGGVKDIDVNVCIIAATNQKIERQVAEGKFRSDLYYRLNVIPLEIPPLRDRPGDIRALAAHFVTVFSRKFGKNIQGFTEEAAAALAAFPWPGNVRELRNVVERGCILSPGGLIEPVHLMMPSASAGKAWDEEAFPIMTLAKAERLAVRAALRASGGDPAKAAATLGVGQDILLRKMIEHGST